MKKILVISDSHGNWENAVEAVRKEEPDMLIHLGDGWSDMAHIRELFPNLPVEQVPGNCDYAQEPPVRVLIIEGRRIMICHGHTYGVKMSLLSLQLAAREKEAELVMFGHTHRVFYDWHNGVRMFNPGSIGAPGYGIAPSYGILTVDAASGLLGTEVFYLE